jgi:crotonobetainyl-CoA:carnitine CoA-transferase CaiB-like acyl-CoA transferase
MAPRDDKVAGMPAEPPLTTLHRHPGPLSGLSVIDISSVIAGPLSTGLLADMGADVIKVELPGVGDALRALAPHKNGVPLWWKVTNRNKRGVTLDLHLPEGREALGRLIERADVLVENFRPGTLERWGIDKVWLHDRNPKLTILRLTGFGQTGPKRDEPGFARVFEAMSGFTHLCGEAGRDPVHLGYPISDAVGGLFGALGVLAALYKLKADPSSAGQEIDCSITESMLRVLEFSAIEYDQLGTVRGRSGNTSQYAAPGNIYRTADGRYASIAASTQSIFLRLCMALGLDHLPTDTRFASNPDRVAHRAALDQIVGDAIGQLNLDMLRDRLSAHHVGFSPISDIADVFADEHLIAREAIISVADDELGPVRMQNVVPRFSATPCEVRSAGPALGAHNDEVWRAHGFTPDQIALMRERKVI